MVQLLKSGYVEKCIVQLTIFNCIDFLTVPITVPPYTKLEVSSKSD